MMKRFRDLQARGASAPRLVLAERCSASLDARRPPILLVHGATFGAALFDLPRPGYSLMAHLAGRGRAIYALDIRGYGRSAAAPAMEAPPDAHAPFARAIEAVQDLGTAVDFILARHATPTLDLVAFSWGTIPAAQFAGDNPHRIGRLVLYAPLCGVPNCAWLDRIADPADPRRLAARFGAWRWVTLADLVSRWDSDLGNHNPGMSRENDIPKLLFDALSALDPRGAARSPRAFRCPNGALADLVDVFNGRPLFDSRRLTMPLLAVRGTADTTSTEEDVRQILACARSPTVAVRSIAGSHFLCIERNRAALYDALDEFLDPVQR